MFKDVFDKYFQNLRNIIPYLLVKTFFDLILLKLCFVNLTLLSSRSFMYNQSNNNLIPNTSSNITINLIVYVVIALATEPVFGAYIRVICKKILNVEGINQIECFTEGFAFYWRLLGIILVVFLIILVFAIFLVITALIPIVGILFFIAVLIGLIYVCTIFQPCSEYLIFKNSTFKEAFDNGPLIGKKYFWRVFLLSLALSITEKLATAKSIRSLIIFVALALIVTAIDSFAILYRMNLCKENNHLDLKINNFEE